MASSPAPPSSSLSFSSSLSLSSDNHHRHLHRHDRIHYRIFSPRFPFRCAITSSSYSSVAAPKNKKKLWRQGEYPGDVNSSSDMKKRRTPIKNIKKKLDRKDNLNPWVKTVTEELSDSINTKQWLRALEVCVFEFYLPSGSFFVKFHTLGIGFTRSHGNNLVSPDPKSFHRNQTNNLIYLYAQGHTIQMKSCQYQGVSRFSILLRFSPEPDPETQIETTSLLFEVFEMLKQQPFYQPKEGTYMKLIVLLGRSGQPQHARNMFNAMIEEGLEPTAELYTALLAAYCRSNLIDEAFKILDQMKTLPFCQPDVYTFSILIKACVDAARFDLVESLYEQMAESKAKKQQNLIHTSNKKKSHITSSMHSTYDAILVKKQQNLIHR
ncbi:hypothetical protein OSB04_029860 [Centaurea solstitialis]|uniref:Pentatricopeptide repeat-containing protein n=1 Tax=Centaurea solstitialis TaxID=347529 RepID=A0AA38VSN6_9ASTR|nr:hypothetical protein OSB04_029860 [Centaurea solstitialis]